MKSSYCSLLTLCCFTILSYAPAELMRASPVSQSTVKPPPSMKVPNKDNPQPRSYVQKRVNKAKNTTYVSIDIPLSEQSRHRSLSAGGQSSAGDVDLNFELEYRGQSASELSAASLTLSFVSPIDQAEKFTTGSNNIIGLQADAYHYNYTAAVHQVEQINTADSVSPARQLKKESITIKLPLEDLQQIAAANRLEINTGKEELQVRSIQLADLQKILLSYNTN